MALLPNACGAWFRARESSRKDEPEECKVSARLDLPAHRWAKRCLFAGLLVFAITLVLAPLNPTRSCGAAAVPPMLGFELATSVADLQDVFGSEGACRAAIASALRLENWIDFAYMVSYGAFLSFGLAALRARGATGLLRLAIVAALVAPLADALENVCLLSMNVDAPGGWLSLLMVASRTKFVLLGIVALALGIETWRKETALRRAFAIAHFPVMPVLLAGILSTAALPAVMPAVAASWLTLLGWAALTTRAAPRERRTLPKGQSPAERG
jgi:hypothetical protein